MRTFVTALLSMILLATLAGCSRAPHGRAKIVTSVFPVFDLTKRVAGDDADVVLATPGDAAAMKDARLAISVGLGLDPWMEDLERASAPKARVLKVGDRVPSTEPIDPYVWLDVQRARLMTKAIAEEMARADSAHASAYRSRANALDVELEQLDHEIEARAAAWAGKPVALSGAGFPCFAERYKVEISTKPGAPIATIDPLGGTSETNSYVALVRFDASAVEHALR